MSPSPANGRVLILRYEAFEGNSRVRREVAALRRAGFQVEALVRGDDELPAVEQDDGLVIRRVSAETALSRLARRISRGGWPSPIRVLAHRASWFLYWRTYLRRAFKEAKGAPAALYWAHDLEALPAAVRAKRRLGGKLLFDSLELYPERTQVDIEHMKLKPLPAHERRARAAYEAHLIKNADRVVVPNDARGVEMLRLYSIGRPTVVRDVPSLSSGRPDVSDLRAKLGIANGQRVVLFLGGQQPGRGLEELIRSVPHLPDCTLVLMGRARPRYRAHLRGLAESEGVSELVRIADAVPVNEVVPYAKSADVGVSPIRNVSLSHYTSLPNKVLEYIAAGIPVVVSDFPDTAALVNRYDVGATCDPDDPRDIARAIRAILDDPDEHQRLRSNARRAARELNWERESEKLISVVRELIGPRNRNN
jgi:glycosyltransferase involved in cell wall biosynthesis